MTPSESARLSLREIREDDAAFILEVLTDPDFKANVGDRGVHDLASARAYVTEKLRPSYGAHGFGLYLVQHRADAVPLGICGLLRRDTHPDIEIGFAFVPRARGRGYALEAARATLEFARDTLALTRIVAVTVPQNRPSIQLLERLGFRHERQLRWTASGPDLLLLAWSAA